MKGKRSNIGVGEKRDERRKEREGGNERERRGG